MIQFIVFFVLFLLPPSFLPAYAMESGASQAQKDALDRLIQDPDFPPSIDYLPHQNFAQIAALLAMSNGCINTAQSTLDLKDITFDSVVPLIIDNDSYMVCFSETFNKEKWSASYFYYERRLSIVVTENGRVRAVVRRGADSTQCNVLLLVAICRITNHRNLQRMIDWLNLRHRLAGKKAMDAMELALKGLKHSLLSVEMAHVLIPQMKQCPCLKLASRDGSWTASVGVDDTHNLFVYDGIIYSTFF
jgi:hypothetical protein